MSVIGEGGGEHGHDDGHGHDHAVLDPELVGHRRAVRAVWISIVGLSLTAAAQLAIVAVSSSAGLFADALHNLGDVVGTGALLVGLHLARRPASQRFTYGWRRSEDLAGLVIVAAIAASAGLALWDSLGALLAGGHTVRNTGWAFAAALLGAVGNEAVAVYKIRVGRDIGSVALAADGQHARVDGLVSLAAAAGVAGAWLGLDAADPLAGLVIAGVIVAILVRTGREVLARNLDGVDAGTVVRIGELARAAAGVVDVHDVRARRVGRSLLIQLHAEVDGALPLRDAHAIAEEIRHALMHELPEVLMVDVHLDPAGEEDAHAPTAHHLGDDTLR